MLIQKSKIIQELFSKKIDFLIIPCFDEWLRKPNDLTQNARYVFTNINNETLDCLLMKNGDIYLFVVDGFFYPDKKETNIIKKNKIKIVYLKQTQKQDEEIVKNIVSYGKKRQQDVKSLLRLGVFGKKTTYYRYEKLNKLCKKNNISVVVLQDDFVCKTKNTKQCKHVLKTNVKTQKLNNNVDFFTTNPDNVSYLCGVRCFKEEFCSCVFWKMFVCKNGTKVLFKSQQQCERFLKKQTQNIVVDKNTTSVYDVGLIKNVVFRQNTVEKLRSVKTKNEINALKKAFLVSDKSLLEVRSFIENNNNLTEYSVYTKLVDCFYKNKVNGLSFKPIVAVNKNSASPHYNKHSTDEYITDGCLVLIDCGVYCEEGYATDTTRVFVKGKPTKEQINVYTLVLKGFLKAYTMTNDTGYNMYNAVKIVINDKINGFVFNHSLGHGIGLCVHEQPPILGGGKYAKRKIKNNMCFTIEPGLYNIKKFGVRLENTFYRKHNKNISLTNVGFEKKLIDFTQLNKTEIKTLEEFVLI